MFFTLSSGRREEQVGGDVGDGEARATWIERHRRHCFRKEYAAHVQVVPNLRLVFGFLTRW